MYKHSRHTTYFSRYHIIFVTKYRKKIFTDEMLKDIEETFLNILEEKGIELIEFNGEEDHVHFIISTQPMTPPIPYIVRMLKSASSKRLRRKYSVLLKTYYKNRIKMWSRSYFYSTVGNVDIETLIKYIEKQKRPE